MNKLTAEQLIIINQKITDRTVSEKVKKSIENIVEIPYEQDDMATYKYKGIVAKSVKLGCSIARIKPFESNNTQTAVLAALTSLELNGISLVNYKEDISQLADFFLSNDIEGGCEWIEKRQNSDNGVDI